jgi:hypothetical protein
MVDGREGIEAFAAVAERPVARTLDRRYVILRASQYCAACQRFMDVGAHAQAHKVVQDRAITTVYLCGDGCENEIDYSGDRLPWAPDEWAG